MPEGHVIHRLARDLNDQLAGRPIVVSSPQGRFAAEASRLSGRELASAQGYGKHLFLGFGGDDIVHVHLGLIGKFRAADPGVIASPGTLRLRLASNDAAFDLRGPQWCRLVSAAEMDAVCGALGPDPLVPGSDPDRGWAVVSRSSRVFGDLLLDQKVAAGVGNIYRAEVLFRQGLSPFLPGNKLSYSAWGQVWADLVELMADGVETGRIDTVRPEHLPEVMGRDPRDDPHGGEVYVYRREKQACHVCTRPVKADTLKGRHLYWCDHCQSRGRGHR